MAPYPAKNTKEASELLIDVSNQLHEIVNEDAKSEISTDSGLVPSVRKALADTFLFQQPIPWQQGQTETAFNQLRTFGTNLYWAPSATLNNPISMGASPEGDSNWPLAPVFVNVDSFAHKELKTVTSVHDLDISFNDGIGVTHGFGQVSFSRLSEATDFNKSGVKTTYAVDEPVITPDGIACFGRLTNLILYSENFSQWSLNGSPTVTSGFTDPNGGTDAFEISISSATQGIYQSGIPSGNTYTYSVWLRGLGAKVRMGSNTSEEITLTDEWVRYVKKQDNAGSMTIYAAEENTTFEVYGAQAVAGNVPNAPYIPTNGTALAREADIPKIQAENNLPANGKPFYIVVDVKETEVNETYARIVRVSDGSLSCYYANGQIAIAVKLSEGGVKTVATSDPQSFKGNRRFVFAYTGSSLVIYADGVKYTEQDCGTLAVNFTSNIFFGSTNGTQYFLNSYLKNFKIKHGVMTDDLAKAYGKWGE